jgi:PPM family protein phosphatase
MDANETAKGQPSETDNVLTSSESGTTPDVGWSIDKGVTRENNEDSLAAVTVNQASESTSQAVGVYAVADGMGGHDMGEVASKLAVRTAIRRLVGDITETNEALPENYQQWLENAVAVANQVVRKTGDEEHKKLGTTLVMAVVVGKDAHIANVGDSRAYLISPTGIRQITHDHSMVQALVDSGHITEAEAENHPMKNVLTQAIGSQPTIDVDLYNETLDDDESILLCSDGLWGTLGDQEILAIVRAAETPSAACQQLIDACNAKGAQDNIAAVLVRPSTDTTH